MAYIVVVPAYGRSYNSKAEVLADWDSLKDFLVQDMFHSGYINKGDKPTHVSLQVRYGKGNTKVMVIN